MICDVIADYHLIGRKMEKDYEATVTDLYFEIKWFLSDVWYLYIADEKGDGFNPVPGVMKYFMEAFTKQDCYYPKLSDSFVM